MLTLSAVAKCKYEDTSNEINTSSSETIETGLAFLISFNLKNNKYISTVGRYNNKMLLQTNHNLTYTLSKTVDI